jgi:geranylgeranyl diphosphate synthase type I
VFENEIKKINKGLQSLLDDANRRYRLRLISDSLFSASREFILRKGKRVRPLLFVLSYKGYAGRKASSDKKLFKSAASIELLHDFMLIHDDVIDNSDLRRGKPTLHKLFDQKVRLPFGEKIGTQLAIVAGDVVFALAIEAFLSIDEEKTRKEKALKQLVQTAAYTGAGEFIDVVYGYKKINRFTESDVFLNYILKTAKYTFECPLLMGAILAGADNAQLRKLSKLGLAAGQAFQIYDDFLDLFASERTIGKSTLSDLAESKKTLLVFRAYRNLKGKKKAQFKRILEKKNKTLADLDLFRRLIVESGSYASCLKKMVSLQEEALRTTRQLKIKTASRKLLEAMITRLSPSGMPYQIKN